MKQEIYIFRLKLLDNVARLAFIFEQIFLHFEYDIRLDVCIQVSSFFFFSIFFSPRDFFTS